MGGLGKSRTPKVFPIALEIRLIRCHSGYVALVVAYEDGDVTREAIMGLAERDANTAGFAEEAFKFLLRALNREAKLEKANL